MNDLAHFRVGSGNGPRAAVAEVQKLSRRFPRPPVPTVMPSWGAAWRLQPTSIDKCRHDKRRHPVPVFAVEGDGRERRQHHGATERRATQPRPCLRQQNGGREFQRSGHEMEPWRVSPPQIFLEDRPRGEDVAERSHDDAASCGALNARCGSRPKNRPAGSAGLAPKKKPPCTPGARVVRHNRRNYRHR